MPPLPPTFDAATTALIENAERRKQDLLDTQIPRLRTCSGPLSVQQTLSAEVREDIDTYARVVESLEMTVDEQRGARSRRGLADVVEAFKAALVSIRKEAREATLLSIRAIESQSKSRRDELLSSSAVTDKSRGDGEDALMKTTDDVTSALQRTISLMHTELSRSVLSTQLLSSSSAALRAASTQHDALALVTGTSKQLLVALERSDWLDRVLVLAALALFLLVVLLVLKQRVLDRAVGAAVWWTRLVPGLGSGAGAKRVMTSVQVETAASSTALSTAAGVVTSAVASTSALAASLLSSGELSTAQTESILSSSVFHETVVPPSTTETVSSMSTPDTRHEEL